ncbi:hypothetical protein DES39_0358 [Orbus hercynius]|uniref:Uncharacterized protein n=1 Tax=Orbus hercynius TaxID=593135 RepID=A0A495RHY7_9GAMM|nr:hypothetical protein [Orbus hercynius]RKS87143.1 hypothetical protein DES39_0358 [Orbus hercynius]
MIITIQDLRTVPAWNGRPGYCASSSRAFFKQYNLDWDAFVHQGIEAEALLATGNALAIHLVEYVKEQHSSYSIKQLENAVEEFDHGR